MAPVLMQWAEGETTGESDMLIQYASDTAVGLYAEKLEMSVRVEEDAPGTQRIVIDLVTNDPAGRGAVFMSESEAQKLRDELDRALKRPRLAAVPKK